MVNETEIDVDDIGAITVKIPIGRGGVVVDSPDRVPLLVTVTARTGNSVSLTIIADKSARVLRVEQIERRLKLFNVGELRDVFSGWLRDVEKWRSGIRWRRSRFIGRDSGSVESSSGD